MLAYEVGRRLPIKLFARLHADIDAHLAADAEAFGFGEFVMHRPARQVVRKQPTPMRPAAAPLARLLLGLVLLLRRGAWVVGTGVVLVCAAFVKQQLLVGIEMLATRSVQTPQQQVEALLHCFQIAIAFVQSNQQFQDHLFEDGRIVGQVSGCARQGRSRIRVAHVYKTLHGVEMF